MSDGYADPDALFAKLLRQHLRPPPTLTVSEWADQYRLLNSKTSAEPGPWRTSRTPYLREPMDCLSANSTYEQVVLQFGTQLGKTECLNNFIGFCISHDPAPMMVVMPTSTLSKRWSQQRLLPLIESTPVVNEVMTRNISRDDSQSQLLKTFHGGALVVAGANSAADLRSMPVRYLLLDEVDAFPLDVDSEGDPISLAVRRTDTFARRKILLTSTPTVRGFSRIEAAYNASDRRQYWVPCPTCEEFQVLSFKGLRWPKGQPELAAYECEHCGAQIEEAAKTWMLERGEWRAANPASHVAGFQLSSLYSPIGWVSWAQIAREFLDAKESAAKGDVSQLKVVVNTRFAEAWEEAGDKMVAHELARRAESYELRTLPAGVCVLTASVDVQGDRLEALVLGWGVGEESWAIDHAVFYGDPAHPHVWKELDEYLQQPIGALKIRACAIDSGGHHTHNVYQFCGERRARHIFAVKGQSQSNKPILGKPTWVDVNHRGVRVKKGAQLWPLGSDTAKSLVYGRLRVTQPGPGYVHLSKALSPEFFEQLTSERLITKYLKGRARLEWVKPAGVRNEALDLYVMATAAAVYVGIPRWSDSDWARVGAKPVARAATPEEPKDEVPPVSVVPRARPAPHNHTRRPGGFVMGWR